MKAVNLLPREAQRSFGSVRSLNGGTNALFGVLAVALVLAAGYVVLANGVTDKRAELARTQQMQAAAERQVAQLKPYSDLETLRQSLLTRVRSLAGGRFDWPTAIDRIVRAFPADTSLTNFEGAAATDGTAPKVTLTGCTPSHDAVAGLIDRLRAVKGVDGVGLTSSTLAAKADAGGGNTECPHTEQFQLTVSMAAPAAAATTGAPAAPGAAPTPAPASPTPVPATGGTP